MAIVLIVAALTVALGVGLGCVPFINEYLHWSILVIVPISGLLIGAGIAGSNSWPAIRQESAHDQFLSPCWRSPSWLPTTRPTTADTLRQRFH